MLAEEYSLRVDSHLENENIQRSNGARATRRSKRAGVRTSNSALIEYIKLVAPRQVDARSSLSAYISCTGKLGDL